jgi:hypothetical protein
MNTKPTFLTDGEQAKPTPAPEPGSQAQPNSSGLSEVGPPQRAETDQDATAQIAELLTPTAPPADEPTDDTPPSEDGDAFQPDQQVVGADEDGDAEDQDLEAGGADDDHTVTVRELADHLGTTAERVYKDLRIPVDGHGEMTIGELKDGFQDRTDARAAVVEREAELQQRESALFAQQQEIAQIQGEIAPYLTPETVNAIEAKASAQQANERQSLMEKVPEFQDQVKFDQFREGIVELLGDFGFQPHEVVITDHRLLLVAREMMRLRGTVKRWADAVEDGRKTGHKANSKGSGGKVTKATGLKRKLAQAAASDDTGTKVDAVATLLKG